MAILRPSYGHSTVVSRWASLLCHTSGYPSVAILWAPLCGSPLATFCHPSVASFGGELCVIPMTPAYTRATPTPKQTTTNAAKTTTGTQSKAPTSGSPANSTTSTPSTKACRGRTTSPSGGISALRGSCGAQPTPSRVERRPARSRALAQTWPTGWGDYRSTILTPDRRILIRCTWARTL